MSKCKVCNKPRSKFVLNNKLVCMRCDELIFDLEIECGDDVEPIVEPKNPGKTIGAPRKPIFGGLKKI